MSVGIRALTYRPTRAGVGSVEVLSFADLRRVDRERRRTEPQRPDFGVIGVVRSGAGRHRVDFTDEPLTAGTVALIQPGQVNRWLDVDHVEGDLVLFTAATVDLPLDLPATWSPPPAVWPLVLTAAEHLREEFDAAVEPSVLEELLAVLVRRASMSGARRLAAPGPLAARFRSQAIDDVTRGIRRSVEQYASELGCAPRTLTRAVRAWSGQSAKEWLDDRVSLEARRLLAHTDLSVAACGRRLGFDDPANFSAHFLRCTRSTPQRWRRRERQHSMENSRLPTDGHGITS